MGSSRQDKLFTVLALFTQDAPSWTVVAAAEALAMPVSTAYRYFNGLTAAGFISPLGGGLYVLGPAIIQLDRQMRLTDPLIRLARPLMRPLVAMAPPESVTVLCRWFKDHVMCVHEEFLQRPVYEVSYERGLPMPPHRGAPSKAILIHLPPRKVRALYDADPADFARVGLGASWPEVRETLRQLRAKPTISTAGELTRGFAGIAAAVFDPTGSPIGSVALIYPDRGESAAAHDTAARAVAEVAQVVTQALRAMLAAET